MRPGLRTRRGDAPLPAERGAGPLLQRDDWGVLAELDRGPRAVARFVAERFCELAPPELVRFRRSDGGLGPLEPDDRLDGRIHGAGPFRVQIVHRDQDSLTLATLEGHAEAGRITFGAYRNVDGDVLFHIRSRARSANRPQGLGFVSLGDAMQTEACCHLVNRLAHALGARVDGFVHAETRRVEPDEQDARADAPTYGAEGD